MFTEQQIHPYGEESSSSSQHQLPPFSYGNRQGGPTTPPHYHQPSDGFDPTTGSQFGSTTPEKLFDLNDDSSSHLRSVPFMELLASEGGFSLVDSSPGLFSSPSPAMAENRDYASGFASFPALLGGTNQQNDRFYDTGINLDSYNGMRSGLLDYHRQNNNIHHSTQQGGSVPVFAPSTPNPIKLADNNNLVSPEAYSVACQNMYTSAAQEENVDSASSRRCVDLQVDPSAHKDNATPLAYDFQEETTTTGNIIPGHPEEVEAEGGLNKLNQQKPRRKKHRPKVVKENQAGKRVPNPKTPKKPVDTNTPPKVKRTYVRRNQTKTPPSPSTTTPPLKERARSSHKAVQKPRAKSAKRTLNFASEDLSTRDDATDGNFQSGQAPSAGTVHDTEIQFSSGQLENNVNVNTTSAYGLSYGTNQILKDFNSMPEICPMNQPRPLQVEQGIDRHYDSPAGVATRSVNGDIADVQYCREQLFYNERQNSTCTAEMAHQVMQIFPANCSSLLQSEHDNSSGVMSFPENCKKRRTGKMLKPNKTSTFQFSACFGSSKMTRTTASSNEGKQYISWADIDRLKKKKRSRSVTRVRDLDSLNAVCGNILSDPPNAACTEILTPPAKKRQKNTHKQPAEASTTTLSFSCKEALAGVVGQRATGKRSKPKITERSKPKTTERSRDFNFKIEGTLLPLPWEEMAPVDVVDFLTVGLQQLHITPNRRSKSKQQSKAIVPYRRGRRKEQNALVLYKRDGTMVVSDQARRKKTRAKVNLDNETERVWKLLLLDINSEGIDGTDEEKAQWWEKERNTFHGRVDSFISRMNDVQGQRKFSPWKGSVVDSVVGVFLTQNVSDHLSSSAFMAMVARFPAKSDTVKRTAYKEQSGPLIEEPEDCEEVACDDTVTANPIEGPLYDKTIHEFDTCYEKQIVECRDCYSAASPKDGTSHYVKISTEAKLDESIVYEADNISSETQAASDLADGKTEDITSSQQSAVSSQNSANSPNAPQVTSQNLEGNSDVENLTLTSSVNSFDHPTSFVALLKTIQRQHRPLSQQDKIEHEISRIELPQDSLVDLNVSPKAHQLHQQMAEFNLKVSDKDSRFLRNSQRMDESCQTGDTAGASMLQGVSGSSYVYRDNWVRSSLEASNHSPIEFQQIEESIFSNSLTKKDERCLAEQSAGTTEAQPFLQEKSSTKVHDPKCFPGTCSCYVLEGEEMIRKSIKQSIKGQESESEPPTPGQESPIGRNPKVYTSSGDKVSITHSTSISTSRGYTGNQAEQLAIDPEHSSRISTEMVKKDIPTKSADKTGKAKGASFDWDSLRREAQLRGTPHVRAANAMDSVNWEEVRCSAVNEVADTIKARGMNNVLAERIQKFLNRLVSDHGSIDLEWLRDVPPDKAKEYLLSFRGLGLKSVECVRLLTLHHLAFPVDTNVGRIAVRLGWVPIQPLPESLQLHLLELYPMLETIQKYLWPRLCKLDQHTLYELHYHMITFGKVFCTKKQPNCNACPLRGECRHFASAFASARLSLPGPEQKSIVTATQSPSPQQDCPAPTAHFPAPLLLQDQLGARNEIGTSEPIVEVPASPEPIVEVPASPEPDQTQCDIEDFYDDDDPNEIPTIKLNVQQFTQNLQTYIQSMQLDESDMCKSIVALTPEAASIPTPKLKNINRLRTEHYVYELPDTHTLLDGMPQREHDDPCPYLLAVWTPGETADSTQPPERKCNPEEPDQLCNHETCSYCSTVREAQSRIVRATLLIPCRTAMRGSFPLNGTYFQVNEVFADHDSSLNPMNVPRRLIWNLPRRTVYFGTSIPTIFKGLSTGEIQQCFYRGYVCVRGFDQKSRAPRPLKARLHFPASTKAKSKGKHGEEDE